VQSLEAILHLSWLAAWLAATTLPSLAGSTAQSRSVADFVTGEVWAVDARVHLDVVRSDPAGLADFPI